MQKDWIISTVNSVKLNPDGLNEPVSVTVKSLLVNGNDWKLGGYLDIGLIDTMKDLIVNFFGAIIFSIIGIGYLKHQGKSKIAAALIPIVKEKDE